MQGRATLAGALCLAGGAASIVGSFLTWAQISAGPFSEPARGIEGWEGKVTLVGGAVMLVAGIRVVRAAQGAIARLRIGGALGALAVTGVGIYTAVTLRDSLLEVAATQLPRAEAERALETGLLELSMGVGLYLVIAGGVQGIVAVLLALGSRDVAPTPSGSGLRNWSVPGDGLRRPSGATGPPDAPPIPPPSRSDGSKAEGEPPG